MGVNTDIEKILSDGRVLNVIYKNINRKL